MIKTIVFYGCVGLGCYLYDYAYTGHTFPEETYMIRNTHRRILPHHLIVKPIPDEEKVGSIVIPETLRQMHVQRGWVTDVSDILEEDIYVDDLVVFVGWKESRMPRRQYDQWEHDLYSMHEDDIELVVEDW